MSEASLERICRAFGVYLLWRSSDLVEVIRRFGTLDGLLLCGYCLLLAWATAFVFAGVWMLVTGRLPIGSELEAMAQEEERRRQSHEGLA